MLGDCVTKHLSEDLLYLNNKTNKQKNIKQKTESICSYPSVCLSIHPLSCTNIMYNIQIYCVTIGTGDLRLCGSCSTNLVFLVSLKLFVLCIMYSNCFSTLHNFATNA